MIRTARLILRPFALVDVPKVFAMGDEAGMRRWIPDQVYRDAAHAEQVVRALMAHTANAPDPSVHPYVLGIEETATGELIGHVGVSPARGSVEIGYAIEDRRQGHGFATEAVAAMAKWASLPELLGIVAVDNVGSCRVLEKAGFVRGEVTGAQRIYRYAPRIRTGS